MKRLFVKCKDGCMKKTIYPRITILVLLIFTVLFVINCGQDDSSSSTCSSGSFSCGKPAGGPNCCPVGTSCCFGYNVCCNETKPHLGRSRSNGAQACYQNLNGEGVTWDLLTVCGKPA